MGKLQFSPGFNGLLKQMDAERTRDHVVYTQRLKSPGQTVLTLTGPVWLILIINIYIIVPGTQVQSYIIYCLN